MPESQLLDVVLIVVAGVVLFRLYSVLGRRRGKVAFTFVGFKDAKVAHAAVKGKNGEITIAFGAQFISATSNKTGGIIDGDTKTVRDVTDVWTFSRDIRSRDPNWVLVATSGDLP